MPQNNYGADKSAWEHFAQTLGLQGDLLPVVSDPSAKISAQSSMSSLGKTPSHFNPRGEVVGIPGWAQKVTTAEEVGKWSADSRLGICLQTRRVRAIDVDIPDAPEAGLVWDVLAQFYLENVGVLPPKRVRDGYAKFLVLLQCEGDRRKDVIKTKHGIIELLGDGNQCVVAGAHIDKDGVSRSRYDWEGGLPNNIPVIPAEMYDSLIAELREKFGVEKDASTALSVSPTRGQKLHQAIEADPVAQFVLNNWQVKSVDRSGQINIVCPFEDSHSTGGGAISSTSVFPAHTNGFSSTAVRCLHANCEHRTTGEFLEAMGYSDPDALTFEDLTKQDSATIDVSDSETVLDKPKKDTPTNPFNFVHVSQLSRGHGAKWAIRDVIPQADFGVVYGASGAGKSFVLLSMAAAICRDGFDWCGKRTTRGKVAFIVAEGGKNFWGRVHAYTIANGITVDDLDMIAVTNAPDLMQEKDAALIASALSGTGVTMLIVDTLAQSFSGDDNNAKDIGVVVRNCQKIGKHLNAMCILVHHAGKDVSKGARGSTALKAASDVEIEVAEDSEERRSIKITKMKDGSAKIPPIYFSLDSVLVGYDEDGSPIDSAAIDFGGA